MFSVAHSIFSLAMYEDSDFSTSLLTLGIVYVVHGVLIQMVYLSQSALHWIMTIHLFDGISLDSQNASQTTPNIPGEKILYCFCMM